MVSWCVAFAAGIWVAKHGICISSLVALCAGIGACVFGDRKVPWLLALLFLTGAVTMTVAQQTDPLAVGRWVGSSVTLAGVVDDVPRIKPSGAGQWNARYRLRIEMGGIGTKSEKANGHIWLTVLQDTAGLQAGYGDHIGATGHLHGLSFYKNPGLPDVASMLARNGLQGRMTVRAEAVQVRSGGLENSATARLGRWRNLLRQRMEKAMPPSDAAVLMGMVFGGYEGIERQTVREFSSTGIVHILSVSGAHVALLAGAMLWMGKRLHFSRVASVWMAAATIAAYGFICGLSPPVVRSILMGFVGLFAVGTGRLADARHALLLSFLAMLVYDPYNLFDIGFQLSFGCTAGLLYLFQPMRELLSTLPEFIRDAVAGTIAAEAAVLPFISWYFGVLPLISVLAAVVVVPLLEATIIIGIGASLAAGLWERAAHMLFVSSSLVIGAGNHINAWLAACPGATLPLSPAWSAAFLPYYGLLLWSAGLLGRGIDSPESLFRRYTGKRIATFGLAAFVLATGLFVWQWTRPAEMEVHFIDVGQGDATLVVTPHHRAILIDTGGIPGQQNTFDVGERVVAPYLRHQGTTVLDWLILTHGHEDHAGGAAGVAQSIGVRRIADNCDESGPLLRLGAVTPSAFRLRVTGTESLEIDGVRLDLFVTAEPAENSPVQQKAGRRPTENERSVVVRIGFGKQCFLVTGDLEGESEKTLIEKLDGSCQVLKVGHHGAKKSTTDALLKLLNPTFAVISVGAENRFGHPHPDTVRRLQEWPVRLYRTDRDGAVVFRTDGMSLSVKKFVE